MTMVSCHEVVAKQRAMFTRCIMTRTVDQERRGKGGVDLGSMPRNSWTTSELALRGSAPTSSDLSIRLQVLEFCDTMVNNSMRAYRRKGMASGAWRPIFPLLIFPFFYGDLTVDIIDSFRKKENGVAQCILTYKYKGIMTRMISKL